MMNFTRVGPAFSFLTHLLVTVPDMDGNDGDGGGGGRFVAAPTVPWVSSFWQQRAPSLSGHYTATEGTTQPSSPPKARSGEKMALYDS